MSATTENPTGTRPHPPLIVRYLLANPVSVMLSLAVIATGLAFGTFWGEHPDVLAAGEQTTLEAGYWWTPITALLVPGTAVEAALTVVLALTVMAFTERLLGSMRTVVLFFVTGAAGVLAGLGIQALALSWGEIWAQGAQFDLALDPAIGVFGVIMAGSALAPGLFRRRIRVIGFVLLVMFALYAGDSDSFFRFIAAVIGLVAGLLLTRGRPRPAWHRSSFAETRTLVASIVAVTGLGPLIVLISDDARGPLALAVAGFTPVDAEEVLQRCANDVSDRCVADLGLAVTYGIGPFLLTLVPLILSLVSAWGLRKGRRAAWILGIAVNVAIAVLTIISLGTQQVLDAATIDVIGPEFVWWAAAAALVPLAVVVLLILTRRRFQVRAPRGAAWAFAAVTVGAFAILAAAHILIGLGASPDDFADVPGPGDLVRDGIRPFIPSGFLVGVPFAATPADGLVLQSFQWVGVAFWAIFILALSALYRATASGTNDEESARFRKLLRRHSGTLGFMGTWPGNDYWFAPDDRGAVAYRVIGGVALTTADPVCRAGDEGDTIRGFVEYCDAQGWSAVFYSVHDACLPTFDELGWQHMSVGEETVVALAGLELTGKPWQKVRQAYNRGLREGFTTLWSTWDDLPVALSSQINAISEQWVSEKELPEMGFTLGGMAELKDPDVYLYLAIDPEGHAQAITSWLPSWSDGKVTGWTIDFMRRGDDSMSGIMEFVIASAALHMKDLGAEVMSLSGAPLATKPGEQVEQTTMTRLLSWLGGVLEPAYGFTSLFRFKSKFNPEYATIHMAYADPTALPNIAVAIGKAYLPEVSPKEYIALARTLTAKRD